MTTLNGFLAVVSAPETSIACEGVVIGAPRALLRGEGAVALAAASAAYAMLDGGWAMYALLFFTPDASMLGYLAGRRIGAVTYNLGHSYALPAALALLGVSLSEHVMWALALIWVAHIGFDRMVGYGLKYATAFGHTHLGIVGNAKAALGAISGPATAAARRPDDAHARQQT